MSCFDARRESVDIGHHGEPPEVRLYELGRRVITSRANRAIP
jgi:hypothetical protein